jgi:Zn ribbon nucleic-acid-binding protein
MTIRKMKPCPKCGNTDLSIYTYDNGWRHVECDECFYLGPGCGNKADAVKEHNERFEALKAAYDEKAPAPAPAETEVGT